MGIIGKLFNQQYFVVEDSKDMGEVVVVVGTEDEKSLNIAMDNIRKDQAVMGIKRIMKMGELL